MILGIPYDGNRKEVTDMNYSENYGFHLPEDGDVYDISHMNENFNEIDGILAENEGQLADISGKIGNPAETGATLFSLMENNQGGSVIKSIQRVTAEIKINQYETNIPIQTVDTAKTFVIFDRLVDESNSSAGKILYTLSGNNIKVTTGGYYCYVGFWIIEFN